MNTLAAAGLAVVVLVVSSVPPALAEAPPPATFPFSVRLTQLRSAKGKIGCSLYAGARGFPTDATAAVQRRWCPISGANSVCGFDPIVQGTYALACFHDENDNGKLDTGLFGIPVEGTVTSNYAKGTFGPPKYDDAKFSFSGQPAEMVLRMSY